MAESRKSSDGAPGPAGAGINPADSLQYISELVLELKGMAEKSGFVTLSCILDLAYHEAKSQARGR